MADRYVNYDKLLEERRRLGLNEMSMVHKVNAFNQFIDHLPTADVVEVKQIEIIRDDLKWWLETNSEKGVVYIPKYVVENMIAKMDSQL